MKNQAIFPDSKSFIYLTSNKFQYFKTKKSPVKMALRILKNKLLLCGNHRCPFEETIWTTNPIFTKIVFFCQISIFAFSLNCYSQNAVVYFEKERPIITDSTTVIAIENNPFIEKLEKDPKFHQLLLKYLDYI